MKTHILCLGDSNTHGYCARPRRLCQSGTSPLQRGGALDLSAAKGPGEEYLVVEEGLSGRTTVFDDPLYEHLSALDYIYPCLKSHEPVSLLIIMLGTNDTKERFGMNAFAIGLGMRRLVQRAQSVDCWARAAGPTF